MGTETNFPMKWDVDFTTGLEVNPTETLFTPPGESFDLSIAFIRYKVQIQKERASDKAWTTSATRIEARDLVRDKAL
jgi:hypothetical protein